MATVVPASFAVDGLVKNVDAEAYEIPTYDEAFPQLVGGGGGVTSPRPDIPNAWKMQPSLRSSSVTQVFSVPVEERRFNEMTDFGEKGGQQAKVCQDIMSKTGVHIEMSLARDQSLNVVITGKQDKVMQARKMVLQALQTQGSVKLQVPREHHKVILGLKGKKLQELELATATKIQIPRPNENSDMITITGPRDGLEKARHELQLISDEQAKLAMERLSIEKEYHPFICGPYNRYQQQLMAETGAKINVPPLSVNKNEIVVSGEKEGVHRAVQQIMAVYNEKKQRCQTVSVEVRKSQHKYVIGPKGTNLGEIMEKTGVSVEVPPLESPSETITLRGEQDNLGPALTAVYSKANSVKVMEVDTPAWLHRFIIGRKGATIQKIMDDLPRVHIEFVEGKDKISVEGPPEEVNQAQQVLSDMTKELLSRMAFAEIEVDQKYHRHIIGKSGANVNRLKEETGVSIKIPGDDQQSNVIRIEGSPEGVARAKLELLDMVSKMENEKKRDIIIDHRFHRTMIGQQGSKIREIRELFNDEVQITIPDSSKQSDVVSLRGPKDQVDKCYKYL
jgi:transcription antitermination factor NusA-like protein